MFISNALRYTCQCIVRIDAKLFRRSYVTRSSCQYNRHSATVVTYRASAISKKEATRSCLIAQDATDGPTSFVYICYLFSPRCRPLSTSLHNIIQHILTASHHIQPYGALIADAVRQLFSVALVTRHPYTPSIRAIITQYRYTPSLHDILTRQSFSPLLRNILTVHHYETC